MPSTQRGVIELVSEKQHPSTVVGFLEVGLDGQQIKEDEEAAATAKEEEACRSTSSKDEEATLPTHEPKSDITTEHESHKEKSEDTTDNEEAPPNEKKEAEMILLADMKAAQNQLEALQAKIGTLAKQRLFADM